MLFLVADDMDDLLCRIHTCLYPIEFGNPAAYMQGKIPTAVKGICVSKEICTFVHSCIPNCYADYNGVKITVRAISTIRPGTPVSISLISDTHLPIRLRKNVSVIHLIYLFIFVYQSMNVCVYVFMLAQKKQTYLSRTLLGKS